MRSWVWIAGAVLVVYVLGSGPLTKLVDAGVLSPWVVAMLYGPLDFISENWDPADRFFEWYLELWGIR